MKNFLLFLLLASLSACSIIPLSPAPTQTLDPAIWRTYQDLNHNFSFVYPKAYDDHAICKVNTRGGNLSNPEYVVSMNNSFIKVTLDPLADPNDTDPQSAVDSMRGYLGGLYQIRFDDPVRRTVNDIPALSQRYLVAYNKDGYQESTFFKKSGRLYTISVQTPSSCDGYPNAPTAEDVYQHILASFQIQ